MRAIHSYSSLEHSRKCHPKNMARCREPPFSPWLWNGTFSLRSLSRLLTTNSTARSPRPAPSPPYSSPYWETRMASVAESTGEGAGAGEAGESASPWVSLQLCLHSKMPAGNTRLKTRKQTGCFIFKAHPSPLHKGRQMPTTRMRKKEKVRGSLVEIVINLLKSLSVSPLLRLPHGSAVKSLPANAGDLVLIPGSRKRFFRRKWQPAPVFLPGESPWTEAPGGYSPWGGKESDMT